MSVFFFSSRRRHTRYWRDWSSDVCSSDLEEQGIVATMFGVGDSMVELMEPTHPDSPVGKFLARRGEGFHHVAFLVEDLEAAIARLKETGVELVDEEPRMGAGGTRTAFVHPKGAVGVLTELVELPGRGG